MFQSRSKLVKILSECQTVWIRVRRRVYPDPSCMHMGLWSRPTGQGLKISLEGCRQFKIQKAGAYVKFVNISLHVYSNAV